MKRKANTPNRHIVPEVSLLYSPSIKPRHRPQVRASEDIHSLLRDYWDEKMINIKEEAKLVLLNCKNRVLGISNLASGGIEKIYIDPKLVFATAVKALATGIILCHNHPSGDSLPSKADIKITKQIKETAELLDITLLDHIIITSEDYYSFADAGIL